jgi:hypothetical protein
MKRTLLLSSAVIALSLGLAPAMAQQDRTDTKVKHERSATEQHDRDTSNKKTQAKDATADKTKAADSDTTKAGADKAKSAEGDKSTSQPKQAEEQNKKPGSKAASDKANTAAPSKNAEQNDTRSPAAQKSTQSTEPSKNAPANAKANDKTNDANRNAQTNAPNRNAATTNNATPNARISASLDPQKKTRVTTAFAKVDAKPVTHVDFSVSVGVAVPRTIDLRPVPTTIVEIVPQYRGYDFFVVRDEVVIVEPRSHKIVDVIERGPSRSRAETTTVHKPQLSAQQREIIRKHARTRRTTTTTTTGTAPRTEIEVGRRLPDTVEIESFPEEVYREVPSVREYRYIERGDDVYLVDPSSREVIEEVR